MTAAMGSWHRHVAALPFHLQAAGTLRYSQMSVRNGACHCWCDEGHQKRQHQSEMANRFHSTFSLLLKRIVHNGFTQRNAATADEAAQWLEECVATLKHKTGFHQATRLTGICIVWSERVAGRVIYSLCE